MKLLSLICLFASLAWGQSYISEAECTFFSNTCTANSNVTAGDYLVVVIVSSSAVATNSISAISDTVGTTFAVIDGPNRTDTFNVVYAGRAPSSNATNVLSVTVANSSAWGQHKDYLFRGLASTYGLDQHTVTHFGPSTTIQAFTAGPTGTTLTNEIAIGAFVINTGGTQSATAGTGYTLAHMSQVTNVNAFVGVVYKVTSAAATQSPLINITQGGGDPNINSIEGYAFTFQTDTSAVPGSITQVGAFLVGP